MDKPKWTDVTSCVFALLALFASGAALYHSNQSNKISAIANKIAVSSNQIAENSNQLTVALSRRNEEFGEYLVKLEQHLIEQSKQPNVIKLAGEIRSSPTVQDCSVLSAVLQNNGERVATVISLQFVPYDPNLKGAMMDETFNRTPTALKVEEVRRDLRNYNWSQPYHEKELFVIPAGNVICLKIAFRSNLGKGRFYLKYSDRPPVQIGQID